MNQALSVEDLYVDYHTNTGVVSALRGVSLSIEKGEILALVGESGCGKSTLGRSILRLNDERSTVYRGSIRYGGTNVLDLPHKQLHQIRGSDIAMIFQDPLRSLNPVFTIGTQLKNAIKIGGEHDRTKIRDAAISLLRRVGLDNAEKRLAQYPHQLSGGQRQRVVIAIALAQKPKVLVADEPTTALDVTTQKQILALLKSLCDELGMSIIFVTHDLAVVWQICDRVAVMYYGVLVEEGTTAEVFDAPTHPYTQGLLAAIPSMATARDKPLASITRHSHDASVRWDDETAELLSISGTHVSRAVTSEKAGPA